MPRAVTIRMTGGQRLQKKLRDTARRLGAGAVLNVGVLASAKYPDGLAVAQNAFWQEFGTKNMPPRPAMRRTIDKHGSRWPDAMAELGRRTGWDTKRVLTLMGEGVKGQIVESINELTDPPLAPSTVARKGFDKPLIETAVYVRSIDYEIVGL